MASGVNKKPLDNLIRELQSASSGGGQGGGAGVAVGGLGGGPFGQLRKSWATLYSSFARRRFVSLSRSNGMGEWPALKPSTIAARRKKEEAKKELTAATVSKAKRGISRRRRGWRRKQIKKASEKYSAKLAGRLLRLGMKRRQANRTAKAFGKGLGRILSRGFRLKRMRLAVSKTPKVTTVSILYDTGILIGSLTIGAKGNMTMALPKGVRFGFGGPAEHENGVTIADLGAIHNSGSPSRNIPARPIIVKPDEATTQRMLMALKRFVERASGGKP